MYFHIIRSLCRLKSNKKLLAILREKCEDEENPLTSKKAIGIMAELYRKGVWKNSAVVNIIADRCFSSHVSVLRKAIRFLLCENHNKEDTDFDESSNLTAHRKLAISLEKGLKGTKRISSRLNKISRLKKKIKKEENEENEKSEVNDFSRIRSLFDPQEFAEKIFTLLKRSKENFETKMLLMKLTARIISCHELHLTNFYSFVQRYMQPHQKNVTKILTYLVQACHSKVQPEVISPCVKTLAYNFVTDRSSPEVIAVGINTIREICSRQPQAIDESFLTDLIEYKKSPVKAISVAARGLLGLYRELNPKLLSRKDRGRPKEKNPEEEVETEEDRNRRLIEAIFSNNKTSLAKEKTFDRRSIDEAEDKNDFIPYKDTENGQKTTKSDEKSLFLDVEQNGRRIKEKQSDEEEDKINEESSLVTPEFPVEEEDLIGHILSRQKEKEELINNQKNTNKNKFSGRKKGGSTNEDKKRKKIFKLSKYSKEVREKGKRSSKLKMKVMDKHNKRMKMKSRRKHRRKAR